MPIICGPHTGKFWEAAAGREAGFVFQPANESAFIQTLQQLISQEVVRRKSGEAAARFCEQRRGATARALEMMRATVKA
jgi:3-deoxy-D-manno-octulosonic-acid transferase